MTSFTNSGSLTLTTPCDGSKWIINFAAGKLPPKRGSDFSQLHTSWWQGSKSNHRRNRWLGKELHLLAKYFNAGAPPWHNTSILVPLYFRKSEAYGDENAEIKAR